jgi:dTDP-4-dehydrorhamnose 3,5-epimerase-like enzyme
MKKYPHFIRNESIGSTELGFISVAEYPKNVPFEVKRIYWTYYTPNNVQRGGHAHHELEQLIFAVSGKITFITEDRFGNKETFVLDEPNKGLFIPKMIWRDIQFSHNAVLLCLASQEYNEADYIRELSKFKSSHDAI